MSDLIDREEAIDALWRALYEFEGKTEKQFQESEDLDVGDWICHRIFVQNMSDIDRQTILNLPSADAVPVIRCKDCRNSDPWYADERRCFLWSENGISVFDDGFCNYAERKEE